MASLLSSLINKFASLPTPSIEKQMQNESLPAMVAGVFSNKAYLQLKATTMIRKLLTKEISPPVVEVTQSGVVPRLVEFLTRYDSPLLQFEAAWALTNIALGPPDSTRVVIDHGAIPTFTMLLGSPVVHEGLREQAALALGSIARESPKSRDLVLSHGALNTLVAQLTGTTNLPMLITGTWTLATFCQGNPQPVFDQVKPALEALGHLVYSDNEDVLMYACWGVSYLSDGTNDKIQAVIDSGICKRLFELSHASSSVLHPALYAVGIIVTGDDFQTQSIINLGLLPYLFNLLTHHHQSSVMLEICWIISNITSRNKDQIQAVIEAGLIGPLVSLLETSEYDVKKQAAWAIVNATCGGTNEQIMFLVSMNCIRPLCDLLISPDEAILHVCLHGLQNILRVGEAERGNAGGVNDFARLIDEAWGSEKIVKLRTHENKGISDKAAIILKTYPIKQVHPTRRQVCARLLKT